MARINRVVTAKKELGKSEATFPSWRITAKSLNTFRSADSFGVQTSTPVEDPHMSLLAKKPNCIWSAPMKKARLRSWQTMAHQSLGQL